MFNLFGKKTTIKDQQRENDRALRKATRDIERERQKMEADEKKLENEIRRNAAAGNNDACRILAKQLVEIRKQKSRNYAAAGKIQSIGYQNKNIGANIALGDAMGSTAKTMSNMNKIIRPDAIAGTVRDFQQANMHMEMTDEMINDTLDDMLNDSDDEAETNVVVNKVLDEIGIEIAGRMSNIPSTGSGELRTSMDRTKNDIADQLSKLRAS